MGTILSIILTILTIINVITAITILLIVIFVIPKINIIYDALTSYQNTTQSLSSLNNCLSNAEISYLTIKLNNALTAQKQLSSYPFIGNFAQNFNTVIQNAIDSLSSFDIC